MGLNLILCFIYFIGWRPRRSIMLCGWDGEESGLIGSIEHVEEYYSQLHDKAIAYINIDSAVYGKFCSVIYLKVAWKSKLIF